MNAIITMYAFESIKLWLQYLFFARTKWRTVKSCSANPCTIFQLTFGLSKTYLMLKFPVLGKHSSTKFEMIRGYDTDDIAENFVTEYLSLILHFFQITMVSNDVEKIELENGIWIERCNCKRERGRYL